MVNALKRFGFSRVSILPTSTVLFVISLIFAFISDCQQSSDFSLGFVFDTTGSMGNDLKQVREGVRRIIKKHVSKGEYMIRDFIVVPVHDPDVGPAEHTENSKKFLRMMGMLYPQGGGDCPEMTVTGIQMALEKALPNSLIYVFTDASAKDYKEVKKVNELIQRKQSQVTFVLTGICNGTDDPGFQVYQDIATMSSGQVYILDKNKVKDFMSIVESAVEAKRVHVLQEDTTRPGPKTYQFPVDSHLTSITLHVTNQHDNMTIKVTIRDPQGKKVTEKEGLKRLMKSVKSVYVASLDKPIPGMWTLEVATQSKQHSVRISGLSEVDFIQGFSPSKVENNELTSRRPLKNVKNYMMANITGKYTGSIDMFHILRVNGTAVVKMEVDQTDNFPIYASRYRFELDPKGAYYIKVTGQDSKGYSLQRYSKIALTPRDLRSVSVSCPSKVQVKRGQTAKISCSIDSEIPFMTKWYKNDVLLQGENTVYKQSTNVTFTVNNANEQSQGRYSVQLTNEQEIKNLKGNLKDSTILDVLPPPPSLFIAANVSIQPGSPASLKCQVFSKSPSVVVRWMRAEPRYELKNSLRYRINTNVMSNKSDGLMMDTELTILGATITDGGEYICEAEHAGGNASAMGSVKIQRPPTAKIDKLKVSFIEKGTFRLICRTDGMPPPKISWGLDGIPLVSGPRIVIKNDFMESILEIRQATVADEGRYTCIAVNSAGDEQADASATYTEAPIVKRIDKSQDVPVEREPLKLSCLAIGTPKPVIKWEFNGSPVSENSIIRLNESSGDLSISEADRSMKGQWTCVALNEAGTVRKSIILDVGYPPKISDFINNIKVNYGDNITLKCNVQGEPSPNVKWYRGNAASLEPIRFGDRIALGRDNSLRINKVSLEDKGEYTCTAMNAHGKDSGTLNMTVGGTSIPVITFTPVRQNSVEGEDQKILSCTVVNDKPKATLYWYFKGKQLEGSTKHVIENGRLYIKKVELGDEGFYTCVASNIVGKAKFEINLDVQTKPTIYGKAKEYHSVTQGTKLQLGCNSTGDPPPSLDWRQDGKPLRPQAGSSILFSSNGDTLTIYHATINDAGTITCTATNKYGSDVKEFLITVKVPPHILREGQTEFEIGKGESSVLTCKVAGPGVVSKMSWFKDGQPLVPVPGRVKILSQNSIEVSGKSQDETGSYECRAKNDAGEDSKYFQITVLLSPEAVSKDVIKRYVKIGQEVTLECKIEGYPTPTKTWRFKGVKIALDNNGYNIQPDSTDPNNIYISDMTTDLQGTYVCEGVNRGGEASLTYEVIILKKPKIVKIPDSSMVIVKNTITLTCEATGSPNPKITWLFKKKKIAEDTIGYRFVGDGTMIIYDAESRNGGEYTCMAQNDAGKDTKDTTVVVYDPGTGGTGGSGKDGSGNRLPTNMTNLPVIQGNNITFSCVMNSTPPAILKWYKNNKEINAVMDPERYYISEDGTTLTVFSVTPADKGKFKCQAINIPGSITKDFVLVVNISPMISKRLSSSQNMDAISGSDVEIKCWADGAPNPTFTWFKDGERVFPSRNTQLKDNGRVLLLKNVNRESDASYLCRAENEAGKDEAAFKVNVLVTPEIAGPTRERPEMPKGRQFALHCNVTGYPQPIIQWSADETYLTRYTRIQDNGAKLLFLNVSQDVVARYSCTARNKAGVANKIFDPIVVYAPEIVNMNENTKRWVLISGELRLSCDATGSPDPSIEWYKDGELVQSGDYAQINISSNNMQLHLFNAQDSDTGSYKCVATNKFGSTRKQWNVEIRIPPKIKVSSKEGEMVVPLDTYFSLFCVAEGKPKPKIEWLKNGIPIDKSKVTIGTGNIEISVKKAKESDAGRYECRAQNTYGQDSNTFDVKVTYPPRLEADGLRYYKINKTVSGSALLECLVTGSPAPEIVWTKNGEKLPDPLPFRLRLINNKRQLEIVQITRDDAARYSCRARNEIGDLEVVHEVNVGAPVRIDRRRIRLEYTIKEDEKLELPCPASGSPRPTLIFTKNSSPIVSNGNTRILVSQERNMMTIFNSVKADSGTYQCNASNSFSFDLVEYLVRVHALPAFDQSNMQSEVHWYLNQTRSLECMLKGRADPPAKISWERKSSIINNSPNVKVSPDGTRLTVMNIQHYDAGEYKCIANNAVGRVSMQFIVLVFVKPSFFNDKRNIQIEAVQNSTQKLSCEARGQPKPEFVWYRRDREIGNDQQVYPNIAITRGEQVLQITNIQRNDAAIYSCSVTNSGGSISKTFNITVIEPPRIKKRTLGPEAIVIPENKVVTLKCFIYDQDKTNVEISWSKNGVPMLLESSEYYLFGSKGHTLSILRPSANESGGYTCSVENKAGQDQQTFKVTVISPPKFPPNFNRYREKMTVQMGERVKMYCMASGSPNPNIRWYYNGEVLDRYLSPGVIFNEEGKILELLSASKESGEYKCVATNTGGSISKTYILEVNMPPLVHLDKTEIVEREGATFTVLCTAKGFPKPDIKWTRDGRGLFRLGTSVNPITGLLTITNAQESDSGRYTCMASNKVNQDSKSVQVKITVRPRVITSPNPIQAKVGTRVLLPCTAEGSLPINVLWTMPNGNQMPLGGLPGFKIEKSGLVVENIKKEDGGRYRCLASNSAGYQTGFVLLDVLVPPKLQQPLNRTKIGMVNSVLQVQCKIEDGQPTPEVFWEQNGNRYGKYNPYYTITESGLFVFNNLKTSDEGDLTCVAKNLAGEARLTYRISVESEAKVSLPISILAYESRSITIKCNVEGKPRPDITWQVNGQSLGILGERVVRNGDNEITINSVKPSDQGNYDCIGRRRGADTVRDTTHLTVFTRPIFKSTPKKTVYHYEGRYTQFMCTADGNPKPEIIWTKDGNRLPAIRSMSGIGKYQFGPLSTQHSGKYVCEARNEVDKVSYSFELVVKTRPTVVVYQSDEPVSERSVATMKCEVKGDADTIIWLKDNQIVKNSSRIRITNSTILTIYDTKMGDTGTYQCIATNPVGEDQGEVKLMIRSQPKFTIIPSNMSVSLGDKVFLTCAAKGYPIPKISWYKDSRRLVMSQTKTIIKNGTLRIVAVSGVDSGAYHCVAKNDMGEIYSPVAKLMVMIHGGWSVWGNWSDCSATCGSGSTSRQRICNNPRSQEGGLPCSGEAISTRSCLVQFCPVDGQWSQWSSWRVCSKTCGAGIRERIRSCDSPPPTNGGRKCSGEAMEDVLCEDNPPCPRDGDWSPWSPWSVCTVTCGNGGTQKKERKCNNPPPANNGQSCLGRGLYVRACVLPPCPQAGRWSEWGYWTICSKSCGNGTQRRLRTCTNPPPSPDGPNCEGEKAHEIQCNTNPCPINGEWSNWSSWTACSTTCGPGMHYRSRTCSEPSPQFNGKLCPGIAKQGGLCLEKNCSDSVTGGRWSDWSIWRGCSETCGLNGRKVRTRICLSQRCVGNEKDTKNCGYMPTCPDSKTQRPSFSAMGEIRGLLNEQDIGVVYLNASWNDFGKKTNFNFKLSDVMPKDQPCFKILTGLLSPIFWIGAYQVANASNGHTVTGGDFTRESTVQFADGSKLQFTHMIRRYDHQIQMRTNLLGKCPNMPPNADIKLEKYVEKYVQMNPALSLIHSYSNRLYRLNQVVQPYSWNHNITSRSGNKQRYLVQQLFVSNIDVVSDPSRNSLRYTGSAVIAKDDNGDSCPSGFQMNSNHNFCSDVNECTDSVLNKCDQICENNVPSFQCRCREGFVLSENGQSCLDINECATKTHKCLSSQQCVNTDGGYKCLIKCQSGLRMREDGSGCEDIDECVEKSNICGIHRCANTYGSYTCRCKPGYMLKGVNCVDVDECKENFHQCAPHQRCLNTPGDHRCEEACNRGYKLDAKQNCVDIDECRTGEAQCPYDAACVNKPGTFQCRCRPGFEQIGTRCDDVDECAAQPSPCSYRCYNTWGSYECMCAAGEIRSVDKKRCYSNKNKCKDGFKWDPATDTCLDIDECKPSSGSPPCQYKCINTHGSYRCECPNGYELYELTRQCKDINECSQNRNLCGAQELCLNTMGSYVCTPVNCPPKYTFDKRRKTCKIRCSDSSLTCPDNSKYADTIKFLIVNMPNYVGGTARVRVVNTQKKLQPNCDYELVENSPNNPISYQSKNGVVYLRVTKSGVNRIISVEKNAIIQPPELFYMFFRVKCYETPTRAKLIFQNSFYIYITISKYPY